MGKKKSCKLHQTKWIELLWGLCYEVGWVEYELVEVNGVGAGQLLGWVRVIVEGNKEGVRVIELALRQ